MGSMTCQSLIPALESILKGNLEESARNSMIRMAIRELKVQDAIIDSLYDALGPAADDIMDDACAAAEELVDSGVND